MLTLQTLIELFEKCDVNHDNDIDQNEAAELNAQLFYMVPRIGFDCEGTVCLWCSNEMGAVNSIFISSVLLHKDSFMLAPKLHRLQMGSERIQSNV